MIEEIKNIKNEKSDFRKFGIVIGLFLLAITGILYWRERESFEILLISGLVLFVLGLLAPVILNA